MIPSNVSIQYQHSAKKQINMAEWKKKVKEMCIGINGYPNEVAREIQERLDKETCDDKSGRFWDSRSESYDRKICVKTLCFDAKKPSIRCKDHHFTPLEMSDAVLLVINKEDRKNKIDRFITEQIKVNKEKDEMIAKLNEKINTLQDDICKMDYDKVDRFFG